MESYILFVIAFVVFMRAVKYADKKLNAYMECKNKNKCVMDEYVEFEEIKEHKEAA